MNYSKGISWIDDCRIPFTNEADININFDRSRLREKKDWVIPQGHDYTNPDYNTQGRFPANLLCSDDMLNDGYIGKSNSNKWIGKDAVPFGYKYRSRSKVYEDKGSNSRYYNIDIWFDELLDKLYLLSDEQNEQK
jgi:hypothetical protein